MEVNKVTMPENISFLNLDDIESIRLMVTKQLRSIGFQGEIIDAADVASAKAAIEASNIDFIISDWNLPDGTGFDFLKEVRANPKYKDTPFLMITTEDAVTNILEAINEGASNYLVKPWKPEEFNEKLSYSWLKHNPTSKKGKK